MAFFWSCAGVFTRLTPLEPMALAGTRNTLAGILCLAILHLRGKKIVLPHGRLWIGIFLTGGTATSFILSLAVGNIGVVLTLSQLAPLFSYFLERRYSAKGVGREILLPCLGVLCGSALIFLADMSETGLLAATGAVLSAVFYASLSVFLKQEVDRDHDRSEEIGLSCIGFGNILSGLLLMPYLNFPTEDFSRFHASGWIGFFGNIFTSGVAVHFFSWAVKFVTSTFALIVGTIEAPVGAFLAYLVLGETLSVQQLVGCLILLCSVLAARRAA